MNRKLTWSPLGWLLGVWIALGGGCAPDQPGLLGYRSTGTFPDEVSNVALDILSNQSFYREAEFAVTEALGKRIESQTPYKLVSRQAADSLISGSIGSVNQRVLSRTFDGGVPQETQVTITVAFEWKDLRNGQVIRRRSTISGSGEYVPARQAGQPFELALRLAADEVADQIVSVMRDDW
jgi:hypothetical protein